ncbi:hypothetical protein Tco_1100460 [Tanacetum coccineum]
MNYEPSSKDAVADDAGKKTNEKPANEKEGYATSTNRVSTVSPSVSAAGQNFDNAADLPTDPLMPDLEDIVDLLNTSVFSGAYDDDIRNPIKAQIQRDAKIAQRLFDEEQAQFEREKRIARERAIEQEAKDAALIEQMEDIQARMDSDELLAERLQQEERE